uniref:4-coumarate:CoA ligase 4 n=1 Tax=Dryopteris fragrans TaxID=239565 RepID=A0A0B4L7S2_9MONI|nr:4-coumarate:CoA ligase 4 [Dryopteris fragrans]
MAAIIDPRSGFCSSNGIFYSKREPVKLPADPSLTFPRFILERPDFDPSAIAYIDSKSGQTLSYGELKAQIQAAASGLLAFGVKPGDVVLVLCPNSIAFAVILLAIMSMGAIVTTTNPLNHAIEIAKQAADSNALFVASLPSLLDKVSGLKLPLILLQDSDKKLLGTQKLGFPSCMTLSELLCSRTENALGHHGRQDDTAALLYSSGTTGVSKGVILTHRNFIAQVLLLQYSNEGLPWNSRIYMCLIPMFHVYGMAFFGSGILAKGATVVLQQKFDFVETLEAIQKYGVTHMPAVPPIIIAFAKSPVVEKFNLSSLVSVGSGAAPLGREVMDSFYSRFPMIKIPQGYGLTETTAVGSHTVTEEEATHFGSVGLLAANTELKIVDVDSGKPLPPCEKGEIWFRGPTIMKGYFGRPGETASTIDKEGWLHTGDLGYVDAEGFLYIVDRLKELIKYKGLQVAPAELEAVLLSHPGIVDAAVIPYADNEAGQIPMAFVVRGPQSVLREVDVIDFVAKQVASYKKVRKVAFVGDIPKSASGKILRRELVSAAMSKL